MHIREHNGGGLNGSPSVTGSLYEAGHCDARQNHTHEKPSRFRPRYRPLTPEELKLHDELKRRAAELEELIEQIPSGRYTALALTNLEESIMFAVKGLTA